MRKIAFMPNTEAAKRQWLNEFQTNLPHFAQTLNLDPTEVQEIDAELTTAIQNIDSVYTKNVELDSTVETRNEHREIFFPILSEFIRRAKTSRNYTKSLGELMSIEVAVSVRQPKSTADSSKLTVKINAFVQKVEFKFKRPTGHHVKIFSRRADETEFKLLEAISGTVYKDIRTNLNQSAAERREYYFVLVKNDVESDRTFTHAVAVLN